MYTVSVLPLPKVSVLGPAVHYVVHMSRSVRLRFVLHENLDMIHFVLLEVFVLLNISPTTSLSRNVPSVPFDNPHTSLLMVYDGASVS